MKSRPHSSRLHLYYQCPKCEEGYIRSGMSLDEVTRDEKGDIDEIIPGSTFNWCQFCEPDKKGVVRPYSQKIYGDELLALKKKDWTGYEVDEGDDED